MAKIPWTRIAAARAGNYAEYLGKHFGFLTILEVDASKPKPDCTVTCKCGAVREYYLWDVVAGRRLSCGCLKNGKTERHRAKAYEQQQQQQSDGWRLALYIRWPTVTDVADHTMSDVGTTSTNEVTE